MNTSPGYFYKDAKEEEVAQSTGLGAIAVTLNVNGKKRSLNAELPFLDLV